MTSPRLKVLHVGAGNLFGGIEAMLVTLASHGESVPSLAHEFAVCFKGRLSEALTQAGARVHQLWPMRLSRPWSVWKARRAFRRVLEEVQPDVVAFHGQWALTGLARVARARRLPVVLWMHGKPAPPTFIDKAYGHPFPSWIIANSAYTAAQAAAWSPTTPRSVIHCPVPEVDASTLRSAESIRAELDTPLTAPVISLVGRLEPLKGQHQLLTALAALPQDLPWFCWIVGGPQRDEEFALFSSLKKRIHDLGLDERVRMCGERVDVGSLLAASDIYCQPNIEPDAFGITFIEAMYSGLPVVTSALGGALEIVTETCGRLVPAGDTDALRESIAMFLVDSDLRRRFGVAAVKRAAALCRPADRLTELACVLQDVVSVTAVAESRL